MKYASNVIVGDIGEASVLGGKQMRDVTPGFFELYKNNQHYPILAVQQAAAQRAGYAKKARNVKHEWTLKDFFPRWDEISAITSGNGTATIVFTPDNINLYREGSTVKFFGGSGGATVHGVVTAKSTTLTVESITGGNFPTLAIGNRIHRYSDSFTELSTLPTGLNTQDYQEYNNIQFMRAPVTVGIFQAGTAQYTGDEEAERREEQDKQIRINFENNLLWGERGKKTINSKTAVFMRGVARYTEELGGDNVLSWDGVNLTQSQWDDWLMESTKYGSNTKMMPMSSTLFRKIHSFSETKDRIAIANDIAGNKNRALGLNIVNYLTPEGKVLKMVNHHGFEEEYQGFGQIIDVGFLDILTWDDYPLFSYRENVHDKDLAGMSHEFWSIATLQVQRPEVNALIKVA